MADRRIEAKEELERALAANKLAKALALAEELERLEPEEGRWPQKTGDILRRQGKSTSAADAFERAARKWAKQGFLARAIAMAKTILTIDPTRRGLLEELDPAPAKREHRRARPGSSALHERVRPIAETAPALTPERGTSENEVRFDDPAPARSIVLDLSELELLVREAEAQEAPPEALQPEELELDAIELDAIELDAIELDAIELDAIEDEPLGDVLFVEEPAEIDRLALLPGFPLFAELPKEALARLAEGATLVELADGAHAVRRGEPADALYAVVSGAVRVEAPGRPVLGEGEVFGESCLTRDAKRSADVIAHGGAVVLRFSKSLLEEITPRVPALERVLAELLGRRLLASALAGAPMFAALSTTERRDVGRLFELRRAPPRIPLLSRGKVGDALYVVLADVIELDDGRVLGPGTLLGARALARAPSELTARAPRGALVLRLTVARLAEWAATHPSWSIAPDVSDVIVID